VCVFKFKPLLKVKQKSTLLFAAFREEGSWRVTTTLRTVLATRVTFGELPMVELHQYHHPVPSLL
jgi:hypothetical protein